MHIHAQCVVEPSQVSPMSVGPIPVSSNSFFERVFACPVAQGRGGGRAAQSTAEGWAWQVLGRARQGKAKQGSAGQGRAAQSRGWALQGRAQRRRQRLGQGSAEDRAKQRLGRAKQ